MELIQELFSRPIFTVCIKVICCLFVTYLLTCVAKKLLRRGEKDIYKLFSSRVIIAFIWAIGWATAISFIPGLGKLTQTLLAGSGIVAVVIGLAAQDSFGNLLSGLFLSCFKPFQIGDRIHLVKSNITGYVEDISLRHTVIRTFTNSRVIVPNSTVNSEIIENANFQTTVASSFIDVSVSYESDVRLAMELFADIVGNHDLYLDQRTAEEIAAGVPKVRVLVRELEANGVALRTSMWTRTIDENFRACSDARLRILEAYRENGIEIPYPHVTLSNPEAVAAGRTDKDDEAGRDET